MNVQLQFNETTGECPVRLEGATGEHFRVFRTVLGGVNPGTYSIMQYGPHPKAGDIPVLEWRAKPPNEEIDMRHSRHASTLFSALVAIGYANRPRPAEENGCRRVPPVLDPSWDDEDVPYDTERKFSSFSAWEE